MMIAIGKAFNRDHRVRCNIGGAAVCKASIAAVVLALGIVSLVQEGTNAMVGLPAGLRPALTMPAVETVALRKGVTVTRHVAVRHRGVAARRTHIAVGRRGAVAVKSTVVERPVRPWVPQPYYGTVFDGVTLGAVIAATAVPTSPSFDVCWYWSNSSQTRGYWDFCQ